MIKIVFYFLLALCVSVSAIAADLEQAVTSDVAAVSQKNDTKKKGLLDQEYVYVPVKQSSAAKKAYMEELKSRLSPEYHAQEAADKARKEEFKKRDEEMKQRMYHYVQEKNIRAGNSNVDNRQK